jgi:hypothetical protein
MLSRRIIKVFLASPGDLGQERKVAFSVVNEFNQIWADHFGYQVDLVGWEDTVSAYGRPQAIINRELEQCELFFGMIWKRWGTKPDTDSKYTSGFEEEFSLSLANCRRSGRPALKLVFKEIDDDLLRDPGDDLKKVLSFRQAIIGKKEVLFETFDTLEQFRQKFHRAIADYIKGLIEKEKTDEGQSPNTERATSGNLNNGDKRAQLFTKEGSDFLKNFIEKTDNKNTISPFEVARFRLLGSIVNKPGNGEIHLSVHDANIVYRDKGDTLFGRLERIGLFVSGLNHFSDETVPVWYWYNELEGFKHKVLSRFSTNASTAVSVGALSAMAVVGEPVMPMGEKGRESYLESWFSYDTESAVKVAALKYLADWGQVSDMPTIQAEMDRSDYQTRSWATDALFRISLRDGPNKTLKLLIETQIDSMDDSILLSIFSNPDRLDIAKLIEATLHRAPKVRLAATNLLRQRNALPPAQAQALLSDASADVRNEALLSLQQNGRHFTETEAQTFLVKSSTGGLSSLLSADSEGEKCFELFKLRELQSRSDDELTILSSGASPFNDNEYMVRAEKYYDKYRLNVMYDIEDRFQAQFLEYRRKLSKAGAEYSLTSEVEEYCRKRLTRAALDIVERRKNASDIGVVRSVLSSGFLNWSDEDADYLGRCGEWEDIQLIADMNERPSYGFSLLAGPNSLRRYRLAAKAAYDLGKARLPELFAMGLEDDLLVKIISIASDGYFQKLNFFDLKVLLYSKPEHVRRTCALKILKSSPKRVVSGILSKYLDGSETYYYNVVHWLDFGVNAPRSVVVRAASRCLANIA